MQPIRILTAVPICDGHDSAINTINLEFIRHGIEVIYLGYHRAARDIARAAIHEDVAAIGLSTYNGGHVEFFAEVLDLLKQQQPSPAIRLFGGGGGTITTEDAEIMRKRGVDRIFFAGTSLEEMVKYVKTTFGEIRQPRYDSSTVNTDRHLARLLTLAENQAAKNGTGNSKSASAPTPKVIGFTGPGGAGKTTLIDELVLRFLRAFPKSARIAILSHDPSIVGSGALLGDRATMIYSQDDRVFMRSIATRGVAGGLSSATTRLLEVLIRSGLFQAILVETVGTGQEAIPFGIEKDLVNQAVMVMPPDYGSRLQLQKIAMLDVADLIVVNKSDMRGAKTAVAEIESRIRTNRKGQKLLRTQANKHRDPNVDQLFSLLFGPESSTVKTVTSTP